MISRKRKRHQRNGKRSQHRKYRVYVVYRHQNDITSDNFFAYITDLVDVLREQNVVMGSVECEMIQDITNLCVCAESETDG